MLGAIIGDLSAWTYDFERETYTSSLTSADAFLSEYGLVALDFAELISKGKVAVPKRIAGKDAALVLCAQTGWAHEDFTDCIALVREICTKVGGDDELLGAACALSELVFRLRHGATKSAAKPALSAVHLPVIDRAWDCFERAWDFTSAVQNSMEADGDRHLLAAVTGEIAEAMYGCENYMMKKTYGWNWYNSVIFPASLMETVLPIIQYKRATRCFFPKNNSLTNVELHAWRPLMTPVEGMVVAPDTKDRIWKGFYPGYDDRYGFYLDNGHVYVYRSASIICRFTLTQLKNGKYRIEQIQTSMEHPDEETVNALDEALYSVMNFIPVRQKK